RKTGTRRVVKDAPNREDLGLCKTLGFGYGLIAPDTRVYQIKPPYRPGDILYVREAWTTLLGSYLYRADQKPGMRNPGKWRPSIHMPREAARIFLRVTDVRVERLQEITYEDCLREGITEDEINERDAFRPSASAKWLFAHLWDGTIKPADRALYSWDANPWVWVIEFERCEETTIREMGIGREAVL
ncbi:MAG: hypothetical protein K2K53_00315, partial [Oscillospiraceae bacterium]|nr:hypothetical protein [Oscillospiraceae bacterium]